MDREIGRIAVEIEERDLARAQDLGDLITEIGGERAGNVARRQAFDALRIEDEETVVLIGLLNRAEPGEELLSRFKGGRRGEGSPRQTQERGVLEKDRGVRQALGPPIDQLAGFQVGDGEERLLDAALEVLPVIPVVEISGREDPRCHDQEDGQKEDGRESPDVSRSNIHPPSFPERRCVPIRAERRKRPWPKDRRE